MSPTPAQYALRAATRLDRFDIQRFMHSLAYTHRHLDWRDALEWLGRQPFWILEKNGELKAVLACIVEPEEVAWVRLFAVDPHLSPSWAWKILFERVYSTLNDLPSRPMIAVLGLQDWFTDLLLSNQFQHFQDILVLSYENPTPPDFPPNPALLILHNKLNIVLHNVHIKHLYKKKDQQK